MAQVNRYLTNKAMDHIDHALGRPVDPLAHTYRNYFYVIGDTELRRSFASSPHWQSNGTVTNGEYFSVTDAGREALAAYLKSIGDKHRIFIVSWMGYDNEVVAETAAKARYRKWLDISDTDDTLSFRKFCRHCRVRSA